MGLSSSVQSWQFPVKPSFFIRSISMAVKDTWRCHFHLKNKSGALWLNIEQIPHPRALLLLFYMVSGLPPLHAETIRNVWISKEECRCWWRRGDRPCLFSKHDIDSCCIIPELPTGSFLSSCSIGSRWKCLWNHGCSKKVAGQKVFLPKDGKEFSW